MERKRIPNPATFNSTVVVELYGNAPNSEGDFVQDLSFFKHSDGRSPNYYCCFAHPRTGKRLHFSCKTTDLKQAKSYAKDHMKKVIREILDRESPQSNIPGDSHAEAHRPYEPLTLSEFAEKFIADHSTKRGHPLRKKSKQALTDSFNQLKKRIGDVYLHQITDKQCRPFIENDQPSQRTAQKHYMNLRGAFRQAQQWEIIKGNPHLIGSDHQLQPIPCRSWRIGFSVKRSSKSSSRPCR